MTLTFILGALLLFLGLLVVGGFVRRSLCGGPRDGLTEYAKSRAVDDIDFASPQALYTDDGARGCRVLV